MNLERLFTVALLAPIMPSVMSILDKVRHQVKSEQNGCCAATGIKSSNLEMHHELPKSFGGSNNRVNIVGLLGEKDTVDVHEIFDELVLREGIMFNGKPISKAVPEQINNKSKWEKACKRFNL